MKASHFPYIALGLGLTLLLAVIKGSEQTSEGETLLPLLTLLLMSEFAVIVNAIGAYLGIKQIRTAGATPAYTLIIFTCMLLCVIFLYLGFRLWPL